MKSLEAATEITKSAAREQFLQMQRRTPHEDLPGRQELFTPTEVILSLAASFVVDYSKDSCRKITPIPELAAISSRSVNSIADKMRNLYGIRSHYGNFEPDLTKQVLGNPELLAKIYRTVFAAARDLGIDEITLPDFLGLETEGSLEFIGQDELDLVELETEVSKQALQVYGNPNNVPSADVENTEKLLMTRARIGQHAFAQRVLTNCGLSCVFCGLSVVKPNGRKLLVASHIKPWKVSEARERLDIQNGLAACPTHDAAFDVGLITVNGGLKIHVSPQLARQALENPVAAVAFSRPPLFEVLALPASAVLPGQDYLQWHKDRIYKSA